MSKRKKRSRAEWTRLVAEWRAGDLGQKAFAEGKGIAPTTPSAWAFRGEGLSTLRPSRADGAAGPGPWLRSEGSPSAARRWSRDAERRLGPLDSAPPDAHLLRKSRTPWTLWTPWTSRRPKSLRDNG